MSDENNEMKENNMGPEENSENEAPTPHTEATSEDQNQSTPEEPTNLELERYKKEMLYLRAEFDNYRKNVLKERENQQKYGSENVLRDFLNILDNFKLAIDIEVNAESIKSFEQGVRMIAKEFEATLERNGVRHVEAVGKAFDPMTQEALGEEESDEHSPGTVIKEFKGAYKLYEKLLRPGQVIIAKEK